MFVFISEIILQLYLVGCPTQLDIVTSIEQAVATPHWDVAKCNFGMVCKKSLPAAKCEHTGRKRQHRFNLHISNMDILQKRLVQNAHSCPKQELKHFATPYIESPSPAVFHNKITKTKRNTAELSAKLYPSWCQITHRTKTEPEPQYGQGLKETAVLEGFWLQK